MPSFFHFKKKSLDNNPAYLAAVQEVDSYLATYSKKKIKERQQLLQYKKDLKRKFLHWDFFQNEWENNPQRLLYEKFDEVMAGVQAYEETYPHQDSIVRFHLFAIEEKLKELFFTPLNNENLTAEEARASYQLLCGFLQFMLRDMQNHQNEDHDTFIRTLEYLLIDRLYYLPLPIAAVAEIDLFNSKVQSLKQNSESPFCLDQQTFKAKEQLKFQTKLSLCLQSCEEMKTNFSEIEKNRYLFFDANRNNYQLLERLAKSIKAEAMDLINNHKSVDYKLYTRILDCAYEAVNSPCDIVKRDCLLKLTNAVLTKPTVGETVAGVLCAIAAGVVMAGAMALTVITNRIPPYATTMSLFLLERAVHLLPALILSPAFLLASQGFLQFKGPQQVAANIAAFKHLQNPEEMVSRKLRSF